jgi:hypothetical protein
VGQNGNGGKTPVAAILCVVILIQFKMLGRAYSGQPKSKLTRCEEIEEILKKMGK